MSGRRMGRREFLAAVAGVPGMVAGAEEKVDGGAGPLLRFGVIADAQYADAEAEGERHYRATPEKLKRAVDGLAGEALPFTLQLGDFIDRDFRSFDVLLPVLGGLGHPARHLLGNHDHTVADGLKGEVAGKLGMPADYYSFRAGGIRFVMTDTNDVSVYKRPAGDSRTAAAEALRKELAAAGVAGAKPWNGGLGEAQLEWLERELAAADTAGERAIVCGHHPLLPADAHQAWRAERVLEVIDRHRCVVAWLNGHNHAGGQASRNGVHFVTFRSLLHRPDTTAWSIVSVYPDRIEIAGRGREPSRSLKLPPL